MGTRAHVCVLGAGIAGVTTAYRLNQDGFDVTVIERRARAGMETSFANGAQLSLANALPWALPGMAWKATRWIFDEDASLFIRPKLSWREWWWIAGFFANCRARAADRNTAALIGLCRRSLRLYHELIERERLHFDYSRKGVLHFYCDRAAYRDARRLGARLAGGERPCRVPVDGAQIVRLEPALAAAAGRIVGGFYAEGDATGDAHVFCKELARVCDARGVRFRYRTRVTGLAPRAGEVVVKIADDGGCDDALSADHAVCCLGSYSPLLLRTAGVFVNVYPVKGYSLTIDLKDAAARKAAPSVSVLDDEHKIVASRLGDRLRVAGTAELDGYNLDIRERRIAPLKNWVRRLFPQISLEYAVPWAGLRPATPSNLPRVGATRHPRLWLNTGHGSLGWTSAMATAEQVSCAIMK